MEFVFTEKNLFNILLHEVLSAKKTKRENSDWWNKLETHIKLMPIKLKHIRLLPFIKGERRTASYQLLETVAIVRILSIRDYPGNQGTSYKFPMECHRLRIFHGRRVNLRRVWFHCGMSTGYKLVLWWAVWLRNSMECSPLPHSLSTGPGMPLLSHFCRTLKITASRLLRHQHMLPPYQSIRKLPPKMRWGSFIESSVTISLLFIFVFFYVSVIAGPHH